MSPTELGSLGTTVAAILTAIALYVRNRGQNRTEVIGHETVDKKALAEILVEVQAVYRGVTEDLQTQVSHLIERDRDCQAQLEQAKADIKQLRETSAQNSQAVEDVKVQLAKES